eukprot:4555277-Amphidinium_carterae.1
MRRQEMRVGGTLQEDGVNFKSASDDGAQTCKHLSLPGKKKDDGYKKKACHKSQYLWHPELDNRVVLNAH